MELDKLKKIYDENFWKNTGGNYNYRSAKLILPLIFKYYKPNSIIDIGCGIGTWLKAAFELGITNIKGIDCNEISEDFLLIPRQYISIDNLETHENVNNEKYDLAISVEVAEHLDNSVSEHFVKTLISYSDVIIFSAAIPYQGGEHHINCQPPDFWCNIFKKNGYVCFDFRNILMNMWEDINPCYSQNLLLYVNKNLMDKFENNFYFTNKPIYFYHPAYVQSIMDYSNHLLIDYNNMQLANIAKNNKINEILLNSNWFSLFGISNNMDHLRLTLFGIKLTFKINEKIINKMAWWIPIKSLRNNFRAKFKRPDQTRPDQTRPDLIFIYVTVTYYLIIIENIKKYNLYCNTKLLYRFFYCNFLQCINIKLIIFNV
ncbi:methyltransferase domain-containing protein [Brachyspira hyodysenteriae]|uniref:methyltransferase domain-containing protein n=1 Tax=Brachyspira hyodysenteriae TaxID=159 RepID=UPI00069BFEF4|nr:methyltransferase domain-containing protein [Brachyspira hyodysenteriae]